VGDPGELLVLLHASHASVGSYLWVSNYVSRRRVCVIEIHLIKVQRLNTAFTAAFHVPSILRTDLVGTSRPASLVVLCKDASRSRVVNGRKGESVGCSFAQGDEMQT
jgi:hypothetical protein